MNTLAIIHAIVASLCLADAPAAPGSGPPASVPALVGQLGSKHYAEREAASRALDALGPQALEQLRPALQSASPEVRRRARALVQAIERRLEAARLLTPTRVRLIYKDAPLTYAVADLAKRTGLALHLEGNQAQYRGRKISLDTGEVSIWEAFFLFCGRAGLSEITPPAANRPLPRAGGMSVTIVGGGNGGLPGTRDIMRPAAPEKPVAIVLVAREPTTPTHLAGSVRFRALPSDGAFVADKKPGEKFIGLEALAEPGTRWREVVAVRLDRAVDDQGQLRKGGFAPPAPKVPSPQRGVVIINGNVIDPPDDPSLEDARLVSLRIEAAAKPARLLKELKGTVTALVQSAPHDLVTVADVFQAAGKRFQGPQGSAVQVVAVTRQAGGGIRLRIEVETPPRALGDNSAVPHFNQTIIINGRRLGERAETLSVLNFALLDVKGKPFQALTAVNTGKRSGPAQEYELTYRPQEGQAGPIRFVYRDRRSAVIDVPFTFKDVPLP